MSLTEPKGWGEDELSRYLTHAHYNSLATFNNLRGSYLRLKEINDLANDFRGILRGTPKWFESFFFLRSHASFLGGVRTAMSGQIPDAFLFGRGCLEAALYEYYIDQKPELQEVWLRRHDSEESRSKCRKAFQMKAMQELFKSKKPELAGIFSTLQDDSIDMGAHPNERGILISASFDKREDQIDIEFEFLSSDREKIQVAMRFVAQAAVCSLKMFRLLYKDRFDLALLNDNLNKVTVGL